ncbi:thioredoxin family protein [Hydrogenimonas sp.]
MKRTILLLLLGAVAALAEITWQPSYEAAKQEAQKSGKPIMALLVSHTCRWCRRLENRTLQNPEVSAYVQKHFVPVLLYREDRNFPDTIRSSMVPTTFFLTPEGKNIIKPVVGYWEPMDYLTDLKMAVKQFKKRRAPR